MPHSAPLTDQREATLVQLRAWLVQQDFPPGTQLPPERDLAEILGVSRGELRKALGIVEAEGQVWRHVGKGTFIGAKRMEMVNLSEITRITNPAEVMRARLLIEPLLAREAALMATQDQLDALQSCIARSEAAETWRQYETADNDFHRMIAQATANQVLLALFDALNAVRRSIAWGQLRPNDRRPPPSHHSFKEHPAILAALHARDAEGASQNMYDHLRNVQRNMLDTSPFAQRRSPAPDSTILG